MYSNSIIIVPMKISLDLIKSNNTVHFQIFLIAF